MEVTKSGRTEAGKFSSKELIQMFDVDGQIMSYRLLTHVAGKQREMEVVMNRKHVNRQAVPSTMPKEKASKAETTASRAQAWPEHRRFWHRRTAPACTRTQTASR